MGGAAEGVNGKQPCTGIVQSYQYSLQYTQKRKKKYTVHSKKKIEKKIRSDRPKDTIN